MRDAKLQARLKLAIAPGLGPIRTAALEQAFDSPVDAADATIAQLRQVPGIGDKLAREIRQGLDAVDLDTHWRLIDQHQVQLISIDDEAYPTLLRHIHDPPPLLFVRGQIQRNDAVGLAIVGARRCTAYGREQADRLAAGAAGSGLCIVSGGARGIDTAAHQAAMRVNGRTIVVLGSGLAEPYPPENRQLFDQIVAGHGAVISELPMTAPPMAENFPRRNRIISGMALGVLVVEAANRSGALITARLAAEEHHREVMAVPGRIDSGASAGCHRIIREGWATLVGSTGDILDALGETGQLLRGAMEQQQQADDDRASSGPTTLFASDEDPPPAPGAAGLNQTQQKLLDAITPDPIDLDQVVRTSGLSIATVQSELTMLELRRLVERLPANRVKRRSKTSD
jgi:DNA processing protein